MSNQKSVTLSILKPPTPLPANLDHSIFLAGSIEMGKAEDWQSRFVDLIKSQPQQPSPSQNPLTILNPRREEWDASWIQRRSEKPFREQVEWELEAQERATAIAMYFAPETKAPITLLELGLFARSGKLVVCCPDGYFRKGNIEVVCDRYNIPLVDTLEDLCDRTLENLCDRARST